MAGNAWDWVKDDNTAAQALDYQVAEEFGWDAGDKLKFGPEGTYTSKNSGEFGGLGRAWLNYSTGGIVRGALWYDDNKAGVFATSLYALPTGTDPNTGFRCVLMP